RTIVRGTELQNAIQEIEAQRMLIPDEKDRKKAEDLLEKSYFSLLKNSLLQAEDAKTVHKAMLYEQSIKNYYTFVDKYKESRYMKNAEKAFFYASDKLKKLKGYGQEQKN